MTEIQTIQVQQHGDVYSCDIGISKEEWLEILQDEKTPQGYKETVLQFYYYPGHRGTCTAVSNSFGGNAQKLNANIRELGKFVQRCLNRFQVLRPDGTPCFWIIPMCEGKDLPQGGEGTFEWELRPELVEAVSGYLSWYLIERYKELRKEIPIDGDKWTELYKWQLITASKGKTPFEIIRSHVANPNKSELGGFGNLIDAPRDNKTLIHLMGTNPEGFQEALGTLLDETKTLNERLANYKSAMASLLPATGFNSKANDERTASVILTCVNPEKYTIYKYDVYTLFCKYMGEEKKSAGQCYHHFLELIEPLRQFATQDKELHQIVAPSLEGEVQSDLLLAQDVLWMLLIEFPQTVGYIRNIMLPNKQRLWLWSGNVNTYAQDSLGCGSSAKTIKDFTIYKSKSALRKAYQQDVGNADLKVPDAYWSFTKEVSVGDVVVVFEPKKGNGKQYHLLHGWGLFTSDCTIVEDDENPMRREVEWHSFLKVPIQNTEMGNSIFFQGTTDKQAQHIKELLNINTEIEMESKYKKYIDLLETNKNLILTGAPGTGKTFMAKAIAEKMGAEVGFVQFHPSYDYTDFVEGLRPIADKHGNVGFIRRDGEFKAFCKSAINAMDNDKETRIGSTVWNVFLSDDSFRKDCMENGYIRIGWADYGDINFDEFDEFFSYSEKQVLCAFQNEMKEGDMIVSCYAPYKVDAIGIVNGAYEFREEGGDYPRYRPVKWLVKNIKEVVPEKGLDKMYTIPTIRKSNIVTEDALKIILKHAPTAFVLESKARTHVFIIDEINRGEISKIFGELFFSIDPGYRGEKGKVDTQYQNMIEEGDVFKDGFHVPENVYIIGTMNDIDRSVESMDFAMRRRFAWQEVTVEESYANMIENDAEFAAVKDEIKGRMFNLNKAIAEMEGLNEAYQIGAAYFRKYLDYKDAENPFDCLWNNHLKGLLFEYLRGNRKAKALLENLHQAYNKTSIDELPAHTNEG